MPENQDDLLRKALEQKEMESSIDFEGSSLGQVKTLAQRIEEKSSAIDELGRKLVDVKELPSRGYFYPNDIEISIRAANVDEIRHFSTLEESDIRGIDTALNLVLKKCLRINSSNRMTYEDLMEIDRLYIILCIRELTFLNGENRLYIQTEDPNEKFEVTRHNLEIIDVPNDVMKYYDSTEKCFVLTLKRTGEKIKIKVPTIGIMKWVKNYVIGKNQEGREYDKFFTFTLPFLWSDHKTLNDISFDKALRDSYGWSSDKISVIVRFTEMLNFGISPTVKLPSGAIVPLEFRGGIKSIFIVSDIFGELLES